MSSALENRVNRRPQLDNKPLVDIISGLIGLPSILVAYELGIFELLAGSAMDLQQICQEKNLSPRAAEAMLSMCVSTGLITKNERQYSLNTLSRQYLLADSSYYYGGFLDLLVRNYESISYPSVKRALLSDQIQAYTGEKDIFEVHAEQADHAAAFTRAMHSSSTGPAQAWTNKLNLSNHQILLDIGGGSGAHSLAALEEWPQLTATLLDLEPVCRIAAEMAAKHKLSDRLTTCPANIWHDAFPQADIHFYSQIYHDWPAEKCRFLTEKSFHSLPPGGRIILHEVLYDDDKQGPLAAAAASMGMLLWTQGRQYSGLELSDMLRKSGFVDIQVMATGFAYWSIVTARKA